MKISQEHGKFFGDINGWNRDFVGWDMVVNGKQHEYTCEEPRHRVLETTAVSRFCSRLRKERENQ